MFFVSISIEDIPEIDLAFILGALSDDTFDKMKDVVSSIVDIYGTDGARYAVIPMGSEGDLQTHFGDTHQTPQDLTNIIRSQTKPEGLIHLKRALDQAKTVFEEASPRSQAKKILVILKDQESFFYPNEVLAGSIALQERGVTVLPVAVGPLADTYQLSILAPSKGILLKVDTLEDNRTIGLQIMNSALKGKLIFAAFLARIKSAD